MEKIKALLPQIIISLIVIVAIVGIALLVSKKTPTNTTSVKLTDSEVLTQLNSNVTKWTQGFTTPKAIIDIFSDFKCPACQYSDMVIEPAIISKYGNKVQIRFRHFPLVQHGEMAQKAAEAAESVGNLAGSDVFWKYANKLFVEQGTDQGAKNFTVDNFLTWAGELGVDKIKVKADLDSGKYTQLVKDSVTLGEKLGVDGTPSWYINGKKVNLNQISTENISKAVEEALK